MPSGGWLSCKAWRRSASWINSLPPGWLYWWTVPPEEEQTNPEGIIKTPPCPNGMISQPCREPVNLHPKDKSNFGNCMCALHRGHSHRAWQSWLCRVAETPNLHPQRRRSQNSLLKKHDSTQLLPTILKTHCRWFDPAVAPPIPTSEIQDLTFRVSRPPTFLPSILYSMFPPTFHSFLCCIWHLFFPCDYHTPCSPFLWKSAVALERWAFWMTFPHGLTFTSLFFMVFIVARVWGSKMAPQGCQ